MLENVIASCLEADTEMAIDAFLDQVVDIDYLVRSIGDETIFEVLGEQEIDRVFTEDEIATWVYENYGIDIVNRVDDDWDTGGIR
jgi:hypothetical protein